MSSSNATNTESQVSKICHGPPPPPNLTDGTSSIQLLSQGAEARVWLITLPNTATTNSDIEGEVVKKQRTLHVGSGIHVPQLLNFTQHPSPLTSSSLQSSTTTRPSSASYNDQQIKIICKERFPKKYRHPQLDISLTKTRTKSEARSLIRCNRANVTCPSVLAIAHWSNLNDESSGNESGKSTAAVEKKSDSCGKVSKSGSGGMQKTSTTSSCLFLECIDGCTVRQYFEQRSTSSSAVDESKVQNDKEAEPLLKRSKVEESTQDTNPSTSYQSSQDRVITVIDKQTLHVANSIGRIVGKMHAAGVIHGDLTTSNIMLRNPPSPELSSGSEDASATDLEEWQAELVLIDFGLAAGTNNNKPNPNNNKKAKHKQQHNAEEKAVDLYVLERAFLSTHPDSDKLVEEVWNGYRAYFESLDNKASGSNNEGDENESIYGHVAKAVLNRLEQVRMRGRKRECFG